MAVVCCAVFPFVAPLMQNRDRGTYRRWIVYLFGLQLVTWVLYASHFNEDFDAGYWYARASPLSRLPVFLMGCAGGFLRLQEGDEQTDGRTTDRVFCAYLVGIILGGLLSTGIGFDFTLTGFLEASCPPMQLAVILDLTRDAGRSRTAQICNTKAVSTLGDISMSFYMLHYSIMMYLVKLHGWATLPMLAVPYSLSISLLVGWGATLYFEKPADKMIRVSKPKPEPIVVDPAIVDTDRIRDVRSSQDGTTVNPSCEASTPGDHPSNGHA